MPLYKISSIGTVAADSVQDAIDIFATFPRGHRARIGDLLVRVGLDWEFASDVAAKDGGYAEICARAAKNDHP